MAGSAPEEELADSLTDTLGRLPDAVEHRVLVESILLMPQAERASIIQDVSKLRDKHHGQAPRWTTDEDDTVISMRYAEKSYPEISKVLTHRTPEAIRTRFKQVISPRLNAGKDIRDQQQVSNRQIKKKIRLGETTIPASNPGDWTYPEHWSPPIDPQCRNELHFNPIALWTVDKIVFEILFKLGFEPNISAQTEGRLARHQIFKQFGCMTQFWTDKHDPGVRVSGKIVLWPDRSPCPRQGCNKVHWKFFRGTYLRAILLGTGQISKKDHEFMGGAWEISHLCHNPWCVNPIHLIIEPRQKNNERNRCKELRRCAHIPPCFLYHKSARATPDQVQHDLRARSKNSMDIATRCSHCDMTASRHELLKHILRVHYPAKPVVPPEERMSCPGCSQTVIPKVFERHRQYYTEHGHCPECAVDASSRTTDCLEDELTDTTDTDDTDVTIIGSDHDDT